MYLKFEKQKNILITTLSGELDHNSAEEVRVKIDDRIDRDNIEKVILNFSELLLWIVRELELSWVDIKNYRTKGDALYCRT